MSGNKLYNLEYLEVVVEEDIPALPSSAKTMIKPTFRAMKSAF